jgi:hypothetical protein
VLKNPGLRRRACRGVRNIANRQTSTTYRVVTKLLAKDHRVT